MMRERFHVFQDKDDEQTFLVKQPMTDGMEELQHWKGEVRDMALQKYLYLPFILHWVVIDTHLIAFNLAATH